MSDLHYSPTTGDDYSDDEILLYDLANRPASFDFVTCLSTAIPLGIKHVRFVLGAWKPKDYNDAEERYLSIVRPAVALFGLTYSVGERRGQEISHMFPACFEVFKQAGRVGKIQMARKPRDYVTLTLRNSRTKARNSNETEWLKFRDMLTQHGRRCIVIREYTERPISLEDRMELYANAYVNMMVINGPLTLCIHSDAPYISMKTIGTKESYSTSPEFMKRIGIKPGFQFPWANADQRLSYLDDTAENMMYEFLCFEERLYREAA